MTERRLRETLRALDPPGADGARRRAWAVSAEALAERPVRARRPVLRAAVALAAAGATVALAVTPPGDAVADWVRGVVAPEHTSRPAVPRPATLPGDGRLLLSGPRGTLIADRHGARRLGSWTGAAWSPRGLFVAVWRGRRLSAVDARGRVRWSVRAPAAIRAAAWSPEGFHVVYRSGSELRVVGGDGRGDTALRRGPQRRPAARVAPVTPAFRPTARRTVAFVGPRGRVEVVEVFTGALLHRSPARLGRGARALAWSGDGSVLAVLGVSRISFWTVGVGRIVTRRLPAGRAGRALAAAPRGRRFAVALEHRGGGATQLALARPDGIAGLLELRGRAISLAWSPGGRWLLAAWPAADQWILVRPQRTGLGAVAAVRGLRGRLGVRAGPVIGGWSGPPPPGGP